MNWFIRFGQWWEKRRVIRAPELKLWVDACNAQGHEIEKTIETVISNFDVRIQSLQEATQIPPAISKEFLLIRARLDRLELLTGLKREPQPIQVPGGPKIS